MWRTHDTNCTKVTGGWRTTACPFLYCSIKCYLCKWLHFQMISFVHTLEHILWIKGKELKVLKIPRSNQLATNFLIRGVRFQTPSWMQNLHPLHPLTSSSCHFGCQSCQQVAIVCYKQCRCSKVNGLHYNANTPACRLPPTLPFPKSC